jgi:N-acetylglucosamine-6-sulfatase
MSVQLVRRRFVATCVAGAVLAVSGMLSSTATPAMAISSTRPNVLNIVLDDMRDGSQAQVRAYMPKTAQWFSSGTFFANADVSTPSCCPSRAAGMTGQYDHNNGMRHQHDTPKFDTATAVQHFLRLDGYQTALVGKYLHEWPLRIST